MSCYFLAHRSKTFVPTLKKSFESCFARQAPNLPTTVTCHRRLVLLMAERQKKPRLIQRHFSEIAFIMDGSLECRATGKTIFTNTITFAIIELQLSFNSLFNISVSHGIEKREKTLTWHDIGYNTRFPLHFIFLQTSTIGVVFFLKILRNKGWQEIKNCSC